MNGRNVERQVRDQYELAGCVLPRQPVCSDFALTSLVYYPYGKVIREYKNGEEKYLTTYHQRDDETGLDYRGARYYDADVPRFFSLDPMSADYPTLSDYCYVANNPLLFFDPDGRTFRIYYKTTDAESGKVTETYADFNGTTLINQDGSEYSTGDNNYVDAVVEAYNYFVDNGADIDNMLSTIASDEEVVIGVKEVNDFGDYYDTRDQTIRWDPTAGLGITDRVRGDLCGSLVGSTGQLGRVSERVLRSKGLKLGIKSMPFKRLIF